MIDGKQKRLKMERSIAGTKKYPDGLIVTQAYPPPKQQLNYLTNLTYMIIHPLPPRGNWEIFIQKYE